MLVWILLGITVVLTGCAQICLKLGVQSLLAHADPARGALGLVIAFWLEWRLLGGLALYGIATLTWLFVLSRLPLSLAYPFVGLSFVTVAALSVVLLGERIVPLQVAGTVLIALGVVLVAMSGNANPKSAPMMSAAEGNNEP
ncbi:EamA family transporter [Methylobacterium mesophilicum SR1.6/6]|uniref:EamA family transporter n=1 Tax=Methylobacterium mesophilicum SR1.6/6 TaxID=908290 RepID=A0A6B9FXK1_9HYPH|nr:EamA family transporter [Methylobacterium mesophilicum]QGY05225.1 EamA family transporter [Methylobacterium mesophilicum SR1.6/6]